MDLPRILAYRIWEPKLDKREDHIAIFFCIPHSFRVHRVLWISASVWRIWNSVWPNDSSVSFPSDSSPLKRYKSHWFSIINPNLTLPHDLKFNESYPSTSRWFSPIKNLRKFLLSIFESIEFLTGDLKRNGLPAIYGPTTSHPGLAPESRQPDPFPGRRGVI